MTKLKNYTAISNIVLFDDRLSPRDKLVYWAIKYHAFGKKTQSFPSLDTIARLSGFSTKHIYKSIQKLELLGYLKVTQRGGTKTNKYDLTSMEELNECVSSTENHSSSDDSHFRQDDSHFERHDSHLGMSQADGQPVDTVQNRASSGEEVQGGRSTSINKEPERLNTGEEKQSAADAGEKKLDSLSLQESKTNGSVAGTNTSGDGGATPGAESEFVNRLFTPTELQATIPTDYKVSFVLASMTFDIFKEQYQRIEGASYFVAKDQIAKARALSLTLFKRFLEFFATQEHCSMTINDYTWELEKFITFAFNNKQLWAYKNSTPVLELFHHNFTALINKYEKRRLFEKSIEDGERRQANAG